ncbi:MAG: ATP-binding protein [Lachnospiraceae bacterium]
MTAYVSSVSCVASARDKSKTENKTFIQGLERFIDAMHGNTYTAIFIAEPVSSSEQTEIRNGYENLYTVLSSFQKSIWSYNENESKSVMDSLSKGISKAVTEGISHTQSHTKNVGINVGLNSSRENSSSVSHTEGKGTSSPTAAARAGQVISGVSGVAGTVIGLLGKAVTISNPALLGAFLVANAVAGAAMQGSSTSSSMSEAITDTIGKSMGLNGGLNAGYARTKADTSVHTDTDTTSETKTEGRTDTTASGRTLQIENVNKSIVEMMNRIEEQLKRVREGEDYGSYSCGAYFLSGKQESCLLAANTYRALMVGENSSVESGAINFWSGDEESEKVDCIKSYLSHFVHPVFAMPVSEEVNNMDDLALYTPGVMVSGLELPLHMGLPTRSVYGLPVLEHAEFGRNVVDRSLSKEKQDDVVPIGKVYHMGQVESRSSVELNMAGLAAHTFITGSTGSGKSNTIYQMLDRLLEKDVHFLVIEPAKGEYKDVFGHRDDVTVYGTNYRYTQMLRINPFSFPEHIHVLEHLDRLIEIFNVCWPMYAAMPAILKDSIERAYEAAGWDLVTSENRYDNHIFPTFSDVFKQIRQVLNESDYSQDNKGDYTGSLVTRLKSLTNGINGLIFTSDEISGQELFDTNVIVDLSRVGSTETKSLIMGLLVLKLQEYRMNGTGANRKLNHVTVLEEAHNLLRRTSVEQTSEGSNLLGKSVEMLANAIAEMRTYGEGFVIADQSPGLLDMSVIRNTNTKIILRLPDFSDRELVGKAAGLTDDQIIELAKLEKGVAAVYQSDWLEPVLCKIDQHIGTGQLFISPVSGNVSQQNINHILASKSLLDCIMNREIYRKGDRVDIQKLKSMVLKSHLDTAVKCDFIDYITVEKEEAVKALRTLVYDFLKAGEAIRGSENCSDITDWVHSVAEKLSPSVCRYSQRQIDLVMALIIYEQSVRDASYNDILCRFTEVYQTRGGVY